MSSRDRCRPLDHLPRDVVAEVLDRHTDKSGDCWVWTRSLRTGYGRAYVPGFGVYPAHRLALLLARGHLAPDEMACHSCDNPPCVNPAHLFAGSQRDNVADMWAKGRAKPGTVAGLSHPRARVSPEQIREAVELHLSGQGTQGEHAAALGVSRSTFAHWVRGDTRPDAGLEGVRLPRGRRHGVDLQPCGTHAAAVRHHKNGEPLCDECRASERKRGRELRLARREEAS